MVDRHAHRDGGTSLRGRDDECAALDDLIDAVREGESRALLVRGEAGVGKSALLEHVMEAASDLRVVRSAGVESEMELGYAALQQLCAPLLDQLDRLPAPQRQALEIVFGLRSGAPPDRFLVGLAVLSLLSEAADGQPLVCLVDDAQWLDRASAQAMAFVARRLAAESVAIVFATREPRDELRGLPELAVEGLRNGDARALLGSAVRFLLDERVRDRLVAETHGNPLALLELPRGLTATQLAGGFGLAGAQTLSGRIEESYRQRLTALPPETVQLLLVAAAEPLGDPLLVWRAAERLGVGVSAAAAAETDGLLTVGQRVTFGHPLVRSAVYGSASTEDRRAAHLALAHVTDPDVDPDRRAWHLAAAAAGPDEEVALELERSAGRAQARGGLAAAAAFLERSVALSGDPARRADRALTAAGTCLQAGVFDTALGLLATAETGALDELQRARVDLLRGRIEFASGGLGGDAPPLLLKAAKQLESLDLGLAREAYLHAWGAAMLAGRAGAVTLQAVCRAAGALPRSSEPRRPVELLLDGLALLIDEGWAAAAPTLRRATSVFAGGDVPAEEGLRWGWMATVASNAVWDDDGTRAICTRQLELVRAAGALAQLPISLVALGVSTARHGDLAAAACLIDETDEIAAATGSRIAPDAALLIAALRGSETEAAALVAAVTQAAERGQGSAATDAYWVASILYNGLGRYEEALAAARQASSEPFDLAAAMWALPELVEAAARSGEADVARDALDRLAATTRPAGTDLGLGVEARSRALLCEGDEAEDRYREAIERLGRTRLRPELARAHLVYGEWLRREGRRVAARTELNAAHERFVTIGMGAFAERARRELVATGARVRRRTFETRDDLTAQEWQIARLARDGLSNPEIGARMFLSPRTVEWHLRKVFTKLGINSRKGLRDALPGADPEPASA